VLTPTLWMLTVLLHWSLSTEFISTRNLLMCCAHFFQNPTPVENRGLSALEMLLSNDDFDALGSREKVESLLRAAGAGCKKVLKSWFGSMKHVLLVNRPCCPLAARPIIIKPSLLLLADYRPRQCPSFAAFCSQSNCPNPFAHLADFYRPNDCVYIPT